MVTIWKVRHKAGEDPDYFTYTLKRNGFYPLILTQQHLTMLFPDLNDYSVPEAPETAKLDITGTLIL